MFGRGCGAVYNDIAHWSGIKTVDQDQLRHYRQRRFGAGHVRCAGMRELHPEFRATVRRGRREGIRGVRRPGNVARIFLPLIVQLCRVGVNDRGLDGKRGGVLFRDGEILGLAADFDDDSRQRSQIRNIRDFGGAQHTIVNTEIIEEPAVTGPKSSV